MIFLHILDIRHILALCRVHSPQLLIYSLCGGHDHIEFYGTSHYGGCIIFFIVKKWQRKESLKIHKSSKKCQKFSIDFFTCNFILLPGTGNCSRPLPTRADQGRPTDQNGWWLQVLGCILYQFWFVTFTLFCITCHTNVSFKRKNPNQEFAVWCLNLEWLSILKIKSNKFSYIPGLHKRPR